MLQISNSLLYTHLTKIRVTDRDNPTSKNATGTR